ncbi:hypothetical protein FX988_03391 [Paraglaciecola mesophila]|uniref:Uncharacterized protein n=1 Tax=Paraglaciecola mesophila TaxID=197222 RepID=A0A857JP26_9ALTE|nr:hypothetical protein [Paraglaciecola mesophila]QHJ13132.1 hypothetical protein FX988_03391 [Paraglaciecola mesophila]
MSERNDWENDPKNDQATESINRLYQQRKAQFKAPPGIKRIMLSSHDSRHCVNQLGRRMGHIALAASTFLLILITFWHHIVWEGSSEEFAQASYTQVTLHSLANHKQSEVISERFAQHYADYLAQRELLVMHHQKHAVLAQLNNGWQLKTCDAQIVKVAQDLIDALRSIHQIEGHFSRGDLVAVRFDKNGIILGIEHSEQYQHC